MSVTFNIERSQSRPAPVCPECGAQSGVRHGRLACPYQGAGDPYPCDGYGPTPPGAFDGLNVSNINAAVILYDLLGYGRDEQDVYAGDLDPADVLRRLATAASAVERCARPRNESRGVYIDDNGVGPGALIVDCGLTVGRVGHYLTTLTALANQAVEAGARITYG